MAKKDAGVYVLKITLVGSKPPIWRRLRISGDATLAKLHDAIQIAMGWEDAHLFEFMVGRERIGGGAWAMDGADSDNECARVRIRELLPRVKSKVKYIYDFGDNWTHEVLLEKVEAPDPERAPVECVAGKGACPPEDCGGIWGYYNLLESIANPDDEDHEESKEWLGESFDPTAFDIEAANKALNACFGKRK